MRREIRLPRVRAAWVEAIHSLRDGAWSTFGVVSVLGVAVAATSGVHAIRSATLDRDVGYRDRDQVVRITVHGDSDALQSLVPYPFGDEVELIREESAALEWIAHYAPDPYTEVGIDREYRLVASARVSPRTLRELGAVPVLGRLFSAADHHAATNPRAVLAVVVREDFAAQVFGSSELAVRARVRIDQRETEIVGVVPNSFRFPEHDTVVWLPRASFATVQSGEMYTRTSAPTVARLADGFSAATAAEEAGAILRRAGLRSERAFFRAEPFATGLTENIRPTLTVLWGGVWLLVIGAIISAASLGAARLLHETPTTAIRRMLGYHWKDAALAGGFRVMVVSVLVAGVSAVVAGWVVSLLHRLSPGSLGAEAWEMARSGANVPVLATLAVVALSETTVGWVVSRKHSLTAISRSRGAPETQWVQSVLLLVAITACTAIVVTTTALGTSAWSLLEGRGGYPDDRLALISLTSDDPDNVKITRSRMEPVMEQFRQLPMVAAVGYADSLPDDWQGTGHGIRTPEGLEGVVAERQVSLGFLPALGVPVLRGRGLIAEDRPNSNTGLIGAGFPAAGELLDQVITVGHRSFRPVGVVGEVVTFPAQERWWNVYRPFDAATDRVEIAVRLNNSVSIGALTALRAASENLDPHLRVVRALSIRDLRNQRLGSPLLASAALAVFAGAGLLLVAMHTVGLASAWAQREMRHLAIRRAIGASNRKLFGALGRAVAVPVTFGVTGGLLGGWIVVRAVASRLVWVESGGPFLYGSCAASISILVGVTWLLVSARSLPTKPWGHLQEP